MLLSFCEQEVPILAGTGDPIVFIDTTLDLSSATTKYSEALSTDDYYIYAGKSGNNESYGLLRFDGLEYLPDSISSDSIVSVTFVFYPADFYSDLDTNLNSASLNFYFLDGDTLWDWSDDSTYIEEKPDMDIEDNSWFGTYDPFLDYDTNDVEIDVAPTLIGDLARDDFLVLMTGGDLENEDFYAIYSRQSSYDPYFYVLYIEDGDTSSLTASVTSDLTISPASVDPVDTTSTLGIIGGYEYSVLLNFPVDTIANMIENDQDLIVAKSELLLPIDTDQSQLYNHSMGIQVNMLEDSWYESFLRESSSYNAASTVYTDDTLAILSTTYQLQEIVVNESSFEGFLISARYSAFDWAKLVLKNEADKKPKLRVILVKKVVS